MNRTQSTVVFVLGIMLLLGAMLISGTNAQDNYEQRIDDLETRVESLETEVNVLKRAIGDESSQPTGQSEQVHVLEGAFTLKGHPGGPYQGISHGGADATTCTGAGAYGQYRAGAEVKVEDESGTLLGTTNLSGGTKVNNITCVFTFSMEVRDAEFYTFIIADTGEVTFSFQEMEDANWSVAFTLDAT